MRNTAFRTALALVACLFATAAAADEKKVPTPADLQGTWRLLSRSVNDKTDKIEGLLFFSGSHMGFLTTLERPDLDPALNTKALEALTSAEKDLFVQAYRGMTSAAGTYVVKDGEIQFTLVVSRQPRLPTKSENRRSWLEGDRLVQDFTTSRGEHAIYVWQRLP